MNYRLTKTSALAATGAAVALGTLTACGGGSGTSGADAALQLKPQTSSTSAPSSPSSAPSSSTSTSTTAPKPSTKAATPKATTRATTHGVSRDQARPTLKPRATATPTRSAKTATPNRIVPTKKAQPVQTPRSTPKPVSNAGLDLSRAGMWDRIAMCESTGNWHINTGNGYYGGLQFDIGTWLGSGGGQFAGRADLATREQQITIANKVFASRGLSPWECASAA